MARVVALYEEDEDEGAFGAEVSFDPAGLWIRHDESINTEHVEDLVQTLLNELEIDEPFIYSWSYTCSKPRLDEFGGGACVVRRNKPVIYCDARNTVETLLEEAIKNEKQETPTN